MANWTKEELLSLHNLKFKEDKTNDEISKILNRTINSVRRTVQRVNWELFLADPSSYARRTGKNGRKWSQAEMGLLYAYLEKGDSYQKIAEKLGRTRKSIERKSNKTDWQAWGAVIGKQIIEKEITIDKEEQDLCEQYEEEEDIKSFVEAMVVLSRREYSRLKEITEEEFRRKVNFEIDALPLPFEEIKDRADKTLESLGLKNELEVEMGEGTYFIVGDSHGKHTKEKIFSLIKNLSILLNPKKIIHIGHLLDDDNDISYNWGLFDNLTIVSKIEELSKVQEQRRKFDFSYEIVRGCVKLGNDLIVINQDLISDYTKTPIKNLDCEIFDDKLIANCHRLELFTRTTEENNNSYVFSPGAICEKHIIKTIKQIDFEDNRKVKQASWEGFNKYRRMKHMYQYWNQGLLVVHVNEKGEHTVIPCFIKKIGHDYFTSYFDKIISNKNTCIKPDKKILISADSHCPLHRPEVLDVLDQISKIYKADYYVNLGDACNYKSLCHHEMDKGYWVNSKTLEEGAITNFILKKQSKWGKKLYINHGNHERFAIDFIKKFPQLEEILNFEFLCSVKELGYEVIGLKSPLKIGNAKFIHGDLIMYCQTGSKLEKASRTFKECIFVGDSHYPSIRFGALGVGFSGEFDQNYNEPKASCWMHGFGICNQYKNVSFPTTIPIINDTCIINETTYTSKNAKDWKMKKFKAKLVYETE